MSRQKMPKTLIFLEFWWSRIPPHLAIDTPNLLRYNGDNTKKGGNFAPRQSEHAMNAFDRIAGYEKEKEELFSLVEIFNNRKKYELKGATLPKGIVFYGEAGTGKTLFAQVLAEECALDTINICLSESASENNICRQIRKAFLKGANSRRPTMIFFDELDKVLPNDREEYYTDRAKSILAQLLTLIDGMEKTRNIVFVATCNNYAYLPASMTRPGRFDKKIGLGLPTLGSRTDILHMYIDNSPADFAMSPESIAQLCGGFSCAALKTLVNECLLQSDEKNRVSETLIREKLREIKEEDIPTERSDRSYMIDATRNVGSFIVSRSYSNSNYLLTIDDYTVCNSFLDSILRGVSDDDDDDDGYEDDDDQPQSHDDPFSCTSDYLATVTALLGGYAAEEVIFNKIYDNLSDNLEAVDNILSYIASCGMLGLDMVFNSDSYYPLSYPAEYIDRFHQKLSEIKNECYQNAKALIEKNEDIVKKLTAMLIKRKSIEKEECEAFLKELGGIRV